MTTVDRAVAWPDTTDQEPPHDHPYRTITWLLGRHPRVAHLVDRLGIVDVDPDGELDLDIHGLHDAVAGGETHDRQWAEYERAHRPPADRDDYTAYDIWLAAGPQPPAGVAAFGVMSGGEQRLLRLLAMLAPGRVPVGLHDFGGLDGDGRRFVADWLAAVWVA